MNNSLYLYGKYENTYCFNPNNDPMNDLTHPYQVVYTGITFPDLS